MVVIVVNKDIVKDQVEVFVIVLGKVNIEIVGGEGDFFNFFVKLLLVGKVIEGVVGKSLVVQDVFVCLFNGCGVVVVVMLECKSGYENELVVEV